MLEMALIKCKNVWAKYPGEFLIEYSYGRLNYGQLVYPIKTNAYRNLKHVFLFSLTKEEVMCWIDARRP